MKKSLKNLKKIVFIKKLYVYLQQKIYQTQVIINYFKKLFIIQYSIFFPSSFKMIDIGGGNFVRLGWENLDYDSKKYGYNSIFIDINYNLFGNNRLPFKNNSVDIFYSSHTLEHIPQIYCQHIFNELYRCLRKKGILRLTVPDFDLYYKSYGSKDNAFYSNYPYKEIYKNFLKTLATYFVDKISEKELRSKYNKLSKQKFADYFVGKIPISSQIKNPSNHINWWTYKKMEKHLIKAGFNKNNIYRSFPQGSSSSHMRGTGVNGFDVRHPTTSLFIEAIK